MKYFTKKIIHLNTIFLNNRIISYKFFSTSTQIIKNVAQLNEKLDEMKSPKGLVVLINGTSSSGKSTLSKHLLTKGFFSYSFDQTYMKLWLEEIEAHSKTSILPFVNSHPSLVTNLWKEYFGFKGYHYYDYKPKEKVQAARNALSLVATNSPKLHDQFVYDKIYESGVHILQTGGCITVDGVFNNEGLLYFNNSFSKGIQQTVHVLRYESILENIKRVINRNTKAIKEESIDFRNPALVLDNFRDLYKIKSVQEISKDILVIDELNIRDIENSIQIIKEHTDILAEQLFDSKLKQKAFVDNVYSSVNLFTDFIDQSAGLSVVAQPNVDLILKVDLLGDI